MSACFCLVTVMCRLSVAVLAALALPAMLAACQPDVEAAAPAAQGQYTQARNHFERQDTLLKQGWTTRARPLPNWGWVLASGIVGILLALNLWASIPVTAVWLIGVLLGIELICEGVALGALAWQARKT
jgi:hypothetical protein